MPCDFFLKFIRKLKLKQALTLDEYNELIELSSLDLSFLVNTLLEEEYESNFFDFRIAIPESLHLSTLFDDNSNEFSDLPILSFALRNGDYAFASSILEILYQPQNHNNFLDFTSIVNRPDNLGQYPLHIAAYVSNFAIVCQLLQLEADPNLLNSMGNSVLLEVDITSDLEKRVGDVLIAHNAVVIYNHRTPDDRIIHDVDILPPQNPAILYYLKNLFSEEI